MLRSPISIDFFANHKNDSFFSQVASKVVLQNWRILIEGTTIEKKKAGTKMSKSVESFTQAVQDWDRIIRGTAASFVPLKNWDSLCNSKKTDIGYQNWKNLMGRCDDKNNGTESVDNWKRLTGKYEEKESDNRKQPIDDWKKLTGRGSKRKEKSESLKDWDNLCNTKYIDDSVDNWKKLSGKYDVDQPKSGSKKPQAESVKDWQKLTGREGPPEAFGNWNKLTGKDGEEPNANKSDARKDWDKLQNTKYGDCSEKNWKKLTGKNKSKLFINIWSGRWDRIGFASC